MILQYEIGDLDLCDVDEDLFKLKQDKYYGRHEERVELFTYLKKRKSRIIHVTSDDYSEAESFVR